MATMDRINIKNSIGCLFYGSMTMVIKTSSQRLKIFLKISRVIAEYLIFFTSVLSERTLTIFSVFNRDNESTNGGSSRINYNYRFIKHNSFAHGYNTRHIEIFNYLMHVGSSIATIARSKGKKALHSASRNGHVEVVRALLEMEPLLETRTDKKGQTTLHMASKGYEFHIYICRLDVILFVGPSLGDLHGRRWRRLRGGCRMRGTNVGHRHQR
ncbi:hypothetical protein ACFE04_009267 [Oxalis oulophora]